MKICILGAGGCFGTNTAGYLLSQGHDVFGIGRSPHKPKCFSLGIDYPYYAYHIHYELDYVLKLLDRERPEVIVNYAAQGEGAASFDPKDYWRFYETNTLGLVKLVGELQQRDWLQRFIHIGTSELYGSVTAPSKETDAFKPTSPYAASKAAFDMHLLAVAQRGFPMNIIRPSNCYCPGQQLHRIIPKALICGLAGRRLPLHGGGLARKSYLHATDLSRAILRVIEAAPLGRTYNVGSDEPIGIQEVVARCAKAIRINFDDLVEMATERKGQDGCYWLDSTKIKSLGWQQKIGWVEGLEGMVEWIKSYPELLTMDTSYRMRA